jgi:hypothetical protein
MADDSATLNKDSGESSAPVTSESGDLISTVDFVPVETDPAAANNTEGTKPDGSDAKSGEGTEGEGATGESQAGSDKKGGTAADGSDDGEVGRLDKHPRFQEMNERMKTAEGEATELRSENAALRDQASKFDGRLSRIEDGESGSDSSSLPFTDITKMSKEELEKWQDDDPVGYANNIVAMSKHETKALLDTALESRSYEDSVYETYEAYATKHPDFDQMWDKGEITRFMDKNPGHNAISAHQVLTAEKKAAEAKTDLDKVKETTAKETEARIMKDIKAKKIAGDSLSAGPASSALAEGSETNLDLKDTKKHGGLTTVLARRSEARSRARLQ